MWSPTTSGTDSVLAFSGAQNMQGCIVPSAVDRTSTSSATDVAFTAAAATIGVKAQTVATRMISINNVFLLMVIVRIVSNYAPTESPCCAKINHSIAPENAIVI